MSTALAVPDKGVVQQAFELALTVPSVGESVREEMNALVAVRGTLLPVEEVARDRLSSQIQELADTLRRSKFTEPMLPLEPLGWRWKNGLPKLAILPIGEGPIFKIEAARGRAGVVSYLHPVLPSTLGQQYKDVLKLAESHCLRLGSERSYSFTFEGVIPLPVRNKIAQVLALRRFESLYMLVETPEKAWEVKTVKGLSRREQLREFTMNMDPLILGWAEKSLWVIDKFDLTTLESYVLDEFSQKALPAGS